MDRDDLLRHLLAGDEASLKDVSISGEYLADLLRAAMRKDVVFAKGLRLRHCRITGMFDIEALSADFPLYMQDCVFEGTVILRHIHVDSLILEGSQFWQVVDARDACITGQIVARRCIFRRPLLLRDCTVTGQANFLGASFHYTQADAQDVRNQMEEHAWGQAFSFARSVAGSFKWIRVGLSRDAVIDLSDAKIGSFLCDLSEPEFAKTWPAPGNLILQGFRADRIGRDDADGNNSPERIVRWLELAPRFTPSAYRSVAAALGNDGLSRGREVVLAALQNREVDNIEAFAKRCFYRIILGVTDYGRKASRPLYGAAACFLLAVGICWQCQNKGLIEPSQSDLMIENCHFSMRNCDKKDVGWRPILINPMHERRYVPRSYPGFSPIAFSIERFVPILKLRQVDSWDFTIDWIGYLHRALASIALFLGGVFIGTVSGLLQPRRAD
jgi:hypothetical protein